MTPRSSSPGCPTTSPEDCLQLWGRQRVEGMEELAASARSSDSALERQGGAGAAAQDEDVSAWYIQGVFNRLRQDMDRLYIAGLEENVR